MIYDELIKRNLVENQKEFSEMIWLRQIKVNNKPIISPKEDYNKNEIKKIRIGILEFEI